MKTHDAREKQTHEYTYPLYNAKDQYVGDITVTASSLRQAEQKVDKYLSKHQGYSVNTDQLTVDGQE